MLEGKVEFINKLENTFWNIGNLFVLFFITLGFLLVYPTRVIKWCISKKPLENVGFCPSVIFFLLIIALGAAALGTFLRACACCTCNDAE